MWDLTVELTRRMADAGVNIEVLYSDHDHRLVLVVDDPGRGSAVADAWMGEGPPLPDFDTVSGCPGGREFDS